MIITPTRSGASKFLAIYYKSISHVEIEQQEPRRLYSLRCSALPYCPRGVLLNYALNGMKVEVDGLMHFYVNVGHSVHNTMQSYLPQVGKFVADYTCRVCKKEYKLSTKSRCCGRACKYEEVTIDYKGIHGHIDGIWKIGNEYWIIDFKTTSLAAAQGKRTKPGINYEWQIKSYAYLLWKQHSIKVRGCMLVFIPRDNPRKPAIWEHVMKATDFEQVRLNLKADKIKHKKTMQAATLSEMKPLLKSRCGDPYCDGCKKTDAFLTKLLKLNIDKFPIKKEEVA